LVRAEELYLEFSTKTELCGAPTESDALRNDATCKPAKDVGLQFAKPLGFGF